MLTYFSPVVFFFLPSDGPFFEISTVEICLFLNLMDLHNYIYG